MEIIFLSDSIAPPLTGIGRYAYEISLGLLENSKVQDVKFFHNAKFIDNPKDLLKPGQVFNTLKKQAPFKSILRPLYQNFRKTMLGVKAKPFQNYILHSPNYYLFPFNGPKVVTIHDISHVRHPECHPKDRVKYLDRHIPKSIEYADHIITVSEFSRREILDYYKLPADKVTAVYNGVSAQFRPYVQENCANTLNKYKLNYKSYLLSVATFEPRKNLIKLIESYAALPSLLKKQYPLVLVGASGWENKDLHSKIKQMIATENIHFLGYVSEQDLPFLYAGARAYPYPSLYEGFGFQVVEAMASGVPVLTSNSSSLKEIAGDSAILCDPQSISSITQGLEQLLTEDDYRESLINKGLKNKEKYSWTQCVNETIDVYQKLKVQ